mmetsp:Transcript_29530/g.28705  ORF Transcript_29530/g.28705 Transcript_29530/m.28705 type:complete len:514 (+) Transcript_29530:2573-4114(+)
MYFNQNFTLMLEIILSKEKKLKPTYNLYRRDSVFSDRWTFDQTLNVFSDQMEFHSKTLYPYNLNLKNFEKLDDKLTSQYSLCKVLENGFVKALNLKDGIELIINPATGKIENYLVLVYSFQTTQDSFYDKKSGQQYVSDVTERLQNFYENNRRDIFLRNKQEVKVRRMDISARNFKHKYLIEQSFTYLDYRFYNQYILPKQQGDIMQVLTQLSTSHIKSIAHNYFPVRVNNSLLHLTAMNAVGFNCVDYLTNLCKREGYVVPFLPNSEDLTPLDMVMNSKDYKQCNSLVRMLGKAPLDHHSRFISHLIPKLIGENLPALQKYFDKRKYQTGCCKSIIVGRVKVSHDQEFLASASNLTNENQEVIQQSIMNKNYKEQSIMLEVLDLPLTSSKFREQGAVNLEASKADANRYEVDLIYSLAYTDNQEIFKQQTVRAFVDYVWPRSRSLIIRHLFLPYFAFIIYYMAFLIVTKKLNYTKMYDPTFFSFTADMFIIYIFMFKLVLFLCCFYFAKHDF